jgi:pyruvate kinase
VEACATMNRIITEVETHLMHKEGRRRSADFKLSGYQEAFLFHAMQMADEMGVRAIVMLTKVGQLIKLMSKFHPKHPLYCLAPTMELARKINHYWGVFPINLAESEIQARIDAGIKLLSRQKIVIKGDKLLFIFRDFNSDTLNLKVMGA